MSLLFFFSEDFRINDLIYSACSIYNTTPIIAGVTI